MANVGIDGLASGLDTTSLINQLMQLESAPQAALKTRASTATSVVSALQGVNSRVASLATSAKELATPAALTAMKATSSSPAATVTATSSAVASSLSFQVTSLAAAHSVLTDELPDAPPGQLPMTVSLLVGRPSTVTFTSWNPESIVAAINAAGAGVSAAAVHVGGGNYRLKVTSDETGAASTFTLSAPFSATTPLSDGADAEISFGAGATARSASGTFTGLMPGVDVTVAALTEPGKPVTVSVAKDTAATAAKVGTLVASLGVVLSDIADRTKTATDGPSGVLVGDSGMRLLRAALSDAVSGLAGGAPLSEIGVELKRDGTVTFDAAKLTAMLVSDPAKAQRMVTALAESVAGIARSASDATTGTISQTITSQQGTVKDLQDRISTWDTRLEVRRATLERQYASLETALQSMNSQSSWLTSALSGLSKSS